MQVAGNQATLRRLPNTDTTVLVRAINANVVSDGQPLAGNSQTTRRRYLILFDDIGAWPLPIKPKEDRLIDGGRAMVILAVDDRTRKMMGQTMAIEVEVSGA
jgi:hypothetical protein